MRKLLASLAVLTLGSMAFAADAPKPKGFSLDDHPGKYLDVLLDGKIAARYVDEHDTSTAARHFATSKPFLHVYDADGVEPITNGGPAGEYPHHRGIFIGWRDIAYNGKKYNQWDLDGSKTESDTVHQKFETEKATADSASFTSIVDWNDETGKPFIVEHRTMTFHRAPPARLIIDFTSKLTAVGDVTLNANAEHGGVQYRPADTLDRLRTMYVIPADHPNPHKDVDYPWVGETYTLNNGKTYSVVEMGHPDDPKGTLWSAYRNYGRFGAFVKRDIKAGETFTLKYRFLIADGDMPALDLIDKTYDEFTGTDLKTTKMTIMPAEKDAPKKTKAPAAPKTPGVGK